jgi:hypothetical protein
VLEPAELTLHRTTAPVQLLAALGLAGDQRVQPVSLDPHGLRVALARWGSTTDLGSDPLSKRPTDVAEDV